MYTKENETRENCIMINVNSIILPDSTTKLYENSNKEDDIISMILSISMNGQEKPIEVLKIGSHYILNDGYKRVEAFKRLGIAEINAIISGFEPKQFHVQVNSIEDKPTETNLVVNFHPSTLIPNSTKSTMYSKPENYNSIKKNIEKHGVIEPLLVNRKTNEIISGNLRCQIAVELGFTEVPVIFMDIEEEKMDVTSISTNQFRTKSFWEVLREIEFFAQQYDIKKGQRSDLNPDLKKLKEERDTMLSGIPRDTINKVKAINAMATDLYGRDSKEYNKIVKQLDCHKTTLNGAYQHLMDRYKRNNNEKIIPEKYEIIKDDVQIYNTSSSNMYQVADKTVNTIVTSPPYFQMKDYGTGKIQIGQERSVDSYLTNLMEVFDECYRVLRDDGSLFVNINDCVHDEKYLAVTHKFVIKMLEKGWMLNDEWEWIKNNPTYTRGKRSVRSHEPIFHFVKSKGFYYNDLWLTEINDPDNLKTYGTNHTNPKLISGMDFRDGILRTNVANTAEIRKQCKDKGFHLTHSATFPIDVPTACLKMTTRHGDTILDPFAGTSVTGEAALRLMKNLKFIGFDLKSEFIVASEVRLSSCGNTSFESPLKLAS